MPVGTVLRGVDGIVTVTPETDAGTDGEPCAEELDDVSVHGTWVSAHSGQIYLIAGVSNERKY